ncbi:MAG: protein translocase subunit SecD [Negativicoccus succinicivorans]|nr:protein translocase subunit SecD [Negativicoccus succinicivorans]
MRINELLKFLLAIAVIIGLFVFKVGDLAGSIKQGLDLQGGTHIVLEAKDMPAHVVTDQDVEQVVKIMERRINEMGLTEPIIQREGSRRIIIELPGERDPEQAIKTIGKTAILQFKDEDGNVRLSGEDLATAKEELGQGNKPLVAIEFNDQGAKKFGDLTTQNVGRHIAIVLDGEVLTNPVVNEPILGGKAVITGNRSLEEAKDLAILLRSGALPVKVDVMEVRTVGPSLGQDSKDKSVMAFAIGLSLITLFMLLIYRVNGFIANVALLVYVLLLLLILKLLHATLTLPGIAGIILSIGMAVDANILIFERFKEEIAAGKVLRLAIQAGFKRAFATIFDANMTVMITALILFVLGSGTIKGFAITLGLGVLVSMFTAITVSRTLLMMLINANIVHNPWLFGARKGGYAK